MADPKRMPLPPSLWPAVYRSISSKPWPPESPREAELFIRSCIANNLLSLLFAADDLPPPVMSAREAVRALDRANQKRTQLIFEGLRRVAAVLDGEPLILLKGSDYAFRLYAAPHLRQMADIDFLIRRDHNEEVQRRLVNAGYEQDFLSGPASRVLSHHETLFRKDGITIEPHHSFIQRTRNAIDYEAIWTRRVAFEANGVHTSRLEDGDAILYAALTLACSEFDVLLIRYLDFYLLLRDCAKDELAALAQRAREWRMEVAFYSSLHQVSVVFPELLPKIDPVLPTLLRPRRRRFLTNKVLPSPFSRRPIGRVEQLWRKFNLMDGYRERTRFFTYHMWASLAGHFAAPVTHRTKSVAARD